MSIISTPEQPFANLETLFDAVKRGLHGSRIKVVEDERAINDEGFAHILAEALAQMIF